MELIPAIDIRGGRCVRLLRGDFDRETRYDLDPVELAVRYRDAGARWLHVVDLDGAKAGRPQNLPLVAADAATPRGSTSSLAAASARTLTSSERCRSRERAVVGSLAVTEPVDCRSLARRARRRAAHARARRAARRRRHANASRRMVGRKQSAVTLAERRRALSLARLAPRALHGHRSRRRVERARTCALYAECVRRWPEVAFVASGGVRDAHDLAALAQVGRRWRPCRGKALLEGTLTPEEMKPFLPAA